MFKKTSVLDELPDLAIDELKKELRKDKSEKEKIKETNYKKIEENVQEPEEPLEEEISVVVQGNNDSEDVEEEFEEETETDDSEEESNEIDEISLNLENSFFNPLLSELKKENFDPAKINEWYQKRFSGKSAIEEMKEHWEKQKNEFITEAVEKEFKSRINKRMHVLQKLESEWQEIYLKLIEKEEELKKEEKNLKKIINDFSDAIKKKGNTKEISTKKGNIKKDYKAK